VRQERGASQILFGFLPQQTADLNGGIWRVVNWVEPTTLDVDREAVRAALVSAVAHWAAAGADNGLFAELAQHPDFDVIGVDTNRGVLVEEFPRLWRCRACGRVSRSSAKCRCGETTTVQLPLVSYHRCGAVEEPFTPSCPVHHEIAIQRSGTTALSEQRFFCPVCKQTVKWGFIPKKCSCDGTFMSTTVHRAASVYTPYFSVIVNPADPAAAAKVREAGGGARALDWVLAGMPEPGPFAGQQTASGLIETLLKGGLSLATAQEFAQQAVDKGEVLQASALTPVGGPAKGQAEEEAFSLATAAEGGRLTLEGLAKKATPPMKSRYESSYRRAVARAKLESVDFLPSFPVLTFSYGYSRDSFKKPMSKLVPFRDRGRLRLHGALAKTEALLFRLDPIFVEAWMRGRGVSGSVIPQDRKAARVSILSSFSGASPVEDTIPASDEALYRLLHSYSHRAIRRLAAFAGIERDSLAEYLVPSHAAFIVYAAAKGDFVLGGLQAVFETSLDRFLDDFVDGESRCPLDPGCRSGGGACMACLHLGEPSCRWFNRLLDRDVLFGKSGFMR
jgi:hypothetical protein